MTTTEYISSSKQKVLRIRRLVGLSIFYCFANGIEALIPFLLLPFLTRFLAPEEYGIWVLFIALLSFMRPVLGLTLQDAVRMKYYEMDKEHLVQFVVTATIISTVIASFFLSLVLLLPTPLSLATKFPGEWLWSIVIMSYLHGIFYTILALLQFREEKKNFVITQGIQSALTIVLAVVLVLMGWSWKGVVLARIISVFAALFVAVKFLIPEFNANLKLFYRPDYVRDLLTFGIRYLPAGLIPVVIPLTDSLFIAHMVDLAEASYFGVGGLFGRAMWLLILGFNFAWQPILFRVLPSNDAGQHRKMMLASILYYLGLPIVGAALVLGALFIAPFVIGSDYSDSTVYILWMVLAGVLQGYFLHNQTYLHCTKQVMAMSVASVLAIVLNPIFNWFFISRYGGIGAAWGTGLAFGIAALLSGILAAAAVRRRISKDSSAS